MDSVTTGVFLTPGELTEIKEMAEGARNAPVITITSGGPDMASLAWEGVRRRLYSLALAHGLPEIVGYYGVDAEGQLLRT